MPNEVAPMLLADDNVVAIPSKRKSGGRSTVKRGEISEIYVREEYNNREIQCRQPTPFI